MAGRTRGRRKRTTQRVRGRRIRLSPKFLGYLVVYLVTAGLLGWAAIAAYDALHSHPRFALSEIQIEGGSTRLRGELTQTLESLEGQNLFRLDLDQIRESVIAHTWVADARVYSQPPSTLAIEITERRPAGLARIGEKVVILSEDGTIIGPYEDYFRVLDLPVITGLTKGSDMTPRIRRGLAALGQIQDVSLLFWDNIETLDISDDDNMKVYLRDEPAPVHLGSRIIGPNLRNYLTIARHIQENYPALDYIELGFPNQIAIMPKQSGTDRTVHGQK